MFELEHLQRTVEKAITDEQEAIDFYLAVEEELRSLGLTALATTVYDIRMDETRHKHEFTGMLLQVQNAREKRDLKPVEKPVEQTASGMKRYSRPLVGYGRTYPTYSEQRARSEKQFAASHLGPPWARQPGQYNFSEEAGRQMLGPAAFELAEKIRMTGSLEETRGYREDVWQAYEKHRITVSEWNELENIISRREQQQG